MSAAEIIDRAMAVGVRLYVEDGRLCCEGEDSALCVLEPGLKAHKAEILRLLAETPVLKHRCFRVTQPPDGKRFLHHWPSGATMAEMSAAYPGYSVEALAGARRAGSVNKETMALVSAAREALSGVHPASVRAVCYKLFVSRHIPSMAIKETQRVSRALVWARENALIPWSWVVDETRGRERIPMWDNPERFADSVQESYRRDYWTGQDTHVEVWSEKGTIRGVLKPILCKYGVGFRVHHGFSSATAVNQIAEETKRMGHQDFVALYVGDYDPSGLHMSEVDLPGRLKEYGAENIEVQRIALTIQDCASLPHFALDSKKHDPRHKWYRDRFDKSRCWEVDAMDPNGLRDRVEAHIKTFIDGDQWRRIEIVELAEKHSLLAVMAGWRDMVRID